MLRKCFFLMDNTPANLERDGLPSYDVYLWYRNSVTHQFHEVVILQVCLSCFTPLAVVTNEILCANVPKLE